MKWDDGDIYSICDYYGISEDVIIWVRQTRIFESGQILNKIGDYA